VVETHKIFKHDMVFIPCFICFFLVFLLFLLFSVFLVFRAFDCDYGDNRFFVLSHILFFFFLSSMVFAESVIFSIILFHVRLAQIIVICSQGKYSNWPPDVAPKVSPIDWAYSKTVLCEKLHPKQLVHLRARPSKCLKMS
jgi:hypothetical protein